MAIIMIITSNKPVCACAASIIASCSASFSLKAISASWNFNSILKFKTRLTFKYLYDISIFHYLYNISLFKYFNIYFNSDSIFRYFYISDWIFSLFLVSIIPPSLIAVVQIEPHLGWPGPQSPPWQADLATEPKHWIGFYLLYCFELKQGWLQIFQKRSAE